MKAGRRSGWRRIGSGGGHQGPRPPIDPGRISRSGLAHRCDSREHLRPLRAGAQGCANPPRQHIVAQVGLASDLGVVVQRFAIESHRRPPTQTPPDPVAFLSAELRPPFFSQQFNGSAQIGAGQTQQRQRDEFLALTREGQGFFTQEAPWIGHQLGQQGICIGCDQFHRIAHHPGAVRFKGQSGLAPDLQSRQLTVFVQSARCPLASVIGLALGLPQPSHFFGPPLPVDTRVPQMLYP